MSSFETLPLHAPLQTALKRLNFNIMTPIQAQSLPVILKGNDVVAQASTGSGKTLAFALGILQNINPRYFAAQSLVFALLVNLPNKWPKSSAHVHLKSEISNYSLCVAVSP